MSKTTELLRTIGVYNSHGFATKGSPESEVHVDYFPSSGGLGINRSKTYIFRLGCKTNPDGPWYNYGDMAIGGIRAESLPLALAWATVRYGIKEWARTPFGSYMDSGYVKRRLKELRKQATQKAEATA
ncbi:MAG: hypothetical protein ABFD89_00955 [Bryobacteraceae bacterium]